MKLEITEKGAHDEDGKEIPVGEEITVKGDAIPGFLVGKCRQIDKPKAKKAAVVNPKEDGGAKEPAEIESKE